MGIFFLHIIKCSKKNVSIRHIDYFTYMIHEFNILHLFLPKSYVGNTAWAHILAARTLRENPELGGQCLFIPDDTPIRNSFDLLEPFLNACGFKLATWSIPYSLIYGALYLTESVIWLISPLYRVNLQTPLCSMIYINKTYYFNRKRAEKVIGYTPLYNYNESLEKSLKYYLAIEI